MNRISRFLITIPGTILLACCVSTATGGTRYRDVIFPSVTTGTGIPFGMNVDILGKTDTLLMDVYQPTGDTVKLRPLVIGIHGGSLVSGSRSEMTPECIDFATRGYVAATIDYRIGVEISSNVTSILEALLRGVQDAKAAVRFFRAHAAQYGIDTSKIFLEGSSAGSMIAVHYAYWDESEIPAGVNQAKWGDIEGTSGNPGHSSAISGIINYAGGIVNPAWINAGEPPIASIDGLDDTIVPQDSAVSTNFGIMLYGGIAIERYATRLGIYNQGMYFPGQGHGGGIDSLPSFGSNFLYSLLVLSSSSPQSFTSMRLTAHGLSVFQYDTYTFHATALDTNGNSIILPQSIVQYSCDSRIGTIAPYGVFTPVGHADSGYVYAKCNGVTDSSFVRTLAVAYVVLSPKFTVTDTIRAVQMTASAFDGDSVQHPLPMTSFKLTSTSPLVGTVDSTGRFKGRANGTTKIIASLAAHSDTSTISVQSAAGMVAFDSFDSLSGWTWSGLNLDSLSVTLSTGQKSEGSASFRIHYQCTYDPSNTSYSVYLNKTLPVFGIPDSIYLDVRSDGRNHRLSYLFSDLDSSIFRGSGKKFLNDSVAFDWVNAPVAGLTSLSGVPQWPVTLRQIQIQLAVVSVQGQVTSGNIYVDNLRLKYPGQVTSIAGGAQAPPLFELAQNYPNPFNPATTIEYRLSAGSDVTLKVYDILGREVRTLVSDRQNSGSHTVTFDAQNLSSGVYFCRLQAGSFAAVRKLLFIK
ncbi:MAG TPA: T9SS type A sorting domain-containing protein [Bacteroidota bacterium]|nr:T9SS type A sorting domain-containing protein [Bacteroidota bacterium]